MISLHAQHSACINYLTHKANGNNFLFLQSRKHKTAQMQTHIPNNLLILSLSQCCSYGKTKRRYFNLYELAKFEWKCNNIMALVCMMYDLWPSQLICRDATPKKIPEGHKSYFIRGTQFLFYVLYFRVNINKREFVIFMVLQGGKKFEALTLITYPTLKE